MAQIISHYNLVGFDRFINQFGGNTQNDIQTVSPSNFYTLNSINIGKATINRRPTPAVSTSIDYKCLTGGSPPPPSATLQGATLTLSNPDTTATVNVAGTWPASAGAGEEDGHHVFMDVTGAVGTPTGQLLAYFVQDTADSSIGWYGAGDRAQNMGGSASDRFFTFGHGDLTASATSETTTQVPWPVPGTFQYISFVYSSTSVTTTTFALRKNGVDSTSITFALANTAGAATLVQDSVLSESVAAGDLINWRYVQNVGGGTFTCVMMCGFIASI